MQGIQLKESAVSYFFFLGLCPRLLRLGSRALVARAVTLQSKIRHC